MNGLSIAGVSVNRKMLSELAISNPESFKQLIDLSKDALNGTLKEAKTEKKVEKSKKEETAKEEKDLSKLTVAELKDLAKAKKISGYTTMKKAELLEALK